MTTLHGGGRQVVPPEDRSLEIVSDVPTTRHRRVLLHLGSSRRVPVDPEEVFLLESVTRPR
jgi:hypothetical protein